MTIRQPLKIFGGKHYLAEVIIELLPRHMVYLEPYAGGLAVLLRRSPQDKSLWWSDKTGEKGVVEIVGDLDLDLTNFWRTLQGGNSFASLRRLCEATPFSEIEWHDADLEFVEWPDGLPGLNPAAGEAPDVVRAWKFFLHARQSLAGMRKSFTGITRTRTRQGMSNETSAWLSAIDGLDAVHQRLRGVLILHRDGVEVIRQNDNQQTFLYCDPPYMHATRTSAKNYRHEMTDEQHVDLLEALASFKGKFVLSGYRSDLYDQHAAKSGWKRLDVDRPNNAATGDNKRRMTECLWLNYQPPS